MRKAPLSVALGRAIRAARDKLEWSQETLAEESDLHRTYIGSVERGERNITILTLAQIAEALGVRSSTLLAEAEGHRR